MSRKIYLLYDIEFNLLGTLSDKFYKSERDIWNVLDSPQILLLPLKIRNKLKTIDTIESELEFDTLEEIY